MLPRSWLRSFREELAAAVRVIFHVNGRLSGRTNGARLPRVTLAGLPELVDLFGFLEQNDATGSTARFCA